MNSLYQKYNIVTEAIKHVVCIMPTNSCNTKKHNKQNTIADGLVFNMI
jgi:hypothetical protein